MTTERSMRLSYWQKIAMINRDARLTIVSNMGLAFSWGVSDVIFNLYFLEAGFAEDFIGLFLSISSFATAAFAVLAGILTDRRSRKKTILAGTAVLLVGTGFEYLTLSPISLLLAQIFIGVAWAFLGVSWNPYTTSVTTKEERMHLFSVRYGFWVIANFAGYLVGGFLPEIWSSLGLAPDLFWAYRFTLWVSLIPLAISWLAIIPMSEDKPQNGDRSFSLRNVRHWGFIAKYGLHWSITGLGAGIFVMFLNIFFNRAFAADSETIGIIFAINTLLLASGNFAYPVLVDKIGKTWTIIVSQSLSIPFLIMLSWSPVLQIAGIAYIIRSVLMNVQLPVMDVFFMEALDSNEQSTALGVINAGDAVGRGIGLNIGGMLLAVGLIRAPFAVASIFYVIGVILFYVFFGRKQKSETASDSLNLS
jgi:MFS family permease